MPSSLYGTRGDYVYTDDQGQAWTVRLYSVIAQAGGFTAGTSSNGPWPYKHKDMRHAVCVDNGGQRVRIPISDLTGGNWETGTTITVNYLPGARTYTVTGFHGERKIASHVPT